MQATHSPAARRRTSSRSTRGLALASIPAAALAVLIAAPGTSTGDKVSPEAASDAAPALPFESYTLDNGLQVILHQDNRVPLVAVSVWYHVGSGNEIPGKSGFAHLFEHMLFQGSEHVGEDRHFDILRNIGATAVNGTTNTDRTNYFEVVPSHHLETALWMESDRMGYLLPLVTDKSLANQIEVVRNERRQRLDNVPYGTTREKIFLMMYPEGHPYRHMTIGKHEDLDGASLADVTNFYKRWYVPANATLSLSGDFEIPAAKELVAKWFGSFPKSDKPTQAPVAPPKMTKERVEIKDKLAKLPMITYVWHTPAFYADGDAEFDLLGEALANPGTGRLYRILVHEKQLAQQVSAAQSSMQFSSLFQVRIQLKTGVDVAQVEKIVEAEIDRVRAEAMSEREFRRAVASVESTFVWGLESLLSRGELLQRYNHYTGDPGHVAKDLARYTGTTADKVRRYAEIYLAPDYRGEIVTLPGN